MEPNRDLSSPVAWRRSLRASQARRAGTARRRRRVIRGRASALAAACACAVGAAGALAQGAAAPSSPAGSIALSVGSQGAAVRALQQALGIPADGIFGPQTLAAVRGYQRSHGISVTGIAGPVTLSSLGIAGQAAQARAASSSSGTGTTTLARIAQCESGGNPAAVSASGRYRGKYQFDRATWRALGGTGDPAKAPEALQDQLAAKLLAARGTAPWPACR